MLLCGKVHDAVFNFEDSIGVAMVVQENSGKTVDRSQLFIFIFMLAVFRLLLSLLHREIEMKGC